MDQNYNEKSLTGMLLDYAAKPLIPMHMPGHKRRPDSPAGDICISDITEVGDFDNLHFPTGVLKRLGERIAALYGGDSGYPLVNGSTCGILAGIYAAVPRGGRAVVAANCHKSVANGLALRDAQCIYIYPQCEGMIFSAVTPEETERALADAPDASLVIITSPTYEGEASDVAAIADICHRRGVPLMVDCAHGAHFGFMPGCPQSPARLGADITVYSLHKTLPSLTQSAAAVLRGGLISPERFAEGLGIFESSSPSYLLLSSIDRCIEYLESRRAAADFAAFSKRMDSFYEKTAPLKSMSVMSCGECSGSHRTALRDKGRITVRSSQLSGRELYGILEKKYGIVCEMAGIRHIVAIPSVCDGSGALCRLADALLEIDSGLSAGAAANENVPFPKLCHVMDSEKASFAPFEEVSIEKAVGRISAASLWAYPPGIPLLLPGCAVTEETVRATEYYVKNGILPENSRQVKTDRILCVKNTDRQL